MAISPPLRSHAQNREDLVLAGLLKGVRRGYYVDVGANHPDHDSVTKLFYDIGWSGLNIEPDPGLHAKLQATRPRDTSLAVGAAAQRGVLRFRRYPETNGLSTCSRQIQAMHAADRPAARHEDIDIPVHGLAELLASHRSEGDIHFLKVDVEGLELEVLLGNDWRRFRPWVLCVERNLDRARNSALAAFVSAQSYEPLHFDGINDFWGARERGALTQQFNYAGDIVMGGALRSAQRTADVPAPDAAGTLAALLPLDGEAFVEAAYQTVLLRAADPTGQADYAGALARGVSKVEILRALARSAEALERGLGEVWEARLPPEPAQDAGRKPLINRLLGR